MYLAKKYKNVPTVPKWHFINELSLDKHSVYYVMLEIDLNFNYPGSISFCPSESQVVTKKLKVQRIFTKLLRRLVEVDIWRDVT